METKPTSVSQLWPSKWLKSVDLQGKSFRVTIADVSVESLRKPNGEEEQSAILSFVNGHKRLIINRTQAAALVGITGSEQFKDWIGTVIVLSPDRAPNGKDTIRIGQVKREQPENNQATQASST